MLTLRYLRTCTSHRFMTDFVTSLMDGILGYPLQCASVESEANRRKVSFAMSSFLRYNSENAHSLFCCSVLSHVRSQ